MSKSLFTLGRIVATPAVLTAIEESEQAPELFLSRHQSGDWGDCCDEDKSENDLSVREGHRIFSVYHTSNGEKLWVITEADRQSTCLLLPSEY